MGHMVVLALPLVFGKWQYIPWCSTGYMMEHWLRDEAVDCCMMCKEVFSFSETKHHSRNCGKIFCAM